RGDISICAGDIATARRYSVSRDRRLGARGGGFVSCCYWERPIETCHIRTGRPTCWICSVAVYGEHVLVPAARRRRGCAGHRPARCASPGPGPRAAAARGG